MTLQRLLMATLGIEDMDLSIVQRHYNVLVRQVQAGDYTLIGRDLSVINSTARPPRRLDLVSLLEV